MCGKALTRCPQSGYGQGCPLAWNVHGTSLNLGWDVHVTWDILACPQCPSRRSHLLLRCKTQALLFHLGESMNQGLKLIQMWGLVLDRLGECGSTSSENWEHGRDILWNMMKVLHRKGETIENMGTCFQCFTFDALVVHLSELVIRRSALLVNFNVIIVHQLSSTPFSFLTLLLSIGILIGTSHCHPMSPHNPLVLSNLTSVLLTFTTIVFVDTNQHPLSCRLSYRCCPFHPYRIYHNANFLLDSSIWIETRPNKDAPNPIQIFLMGCLD